MCTSVCVLVCILKGRLPECSKRMGDLSRNVLLSGKFRASVRMRKCVCGCPNVRFWCVCVEKVHGMYGVLCFAVPKYMQSKG